MCSEEDLWTSAETAGVLVWWALLLAGTLVWIGRVTPPYGFTIGPFAN